MPSNRREKKLRARSRKVSDRSVGFGKVRHGDIYWLPPKENCGEVTLITGDIKIEDGCYDHPVVIFAINEVAQVVLALSITSLGGISLEERYPSPGQFWIRSRRIAIAPAVHPDMELQLELEENLSLRKKSYVCIEAPKHIPIKFLRRLDDGHRRLTPKSYQRLRHHIVFSTPEGFQCLDQIAATPHVFMASQGFDDATRDLLESNNVRGPCPSPQVFPSARPLHVPSTSSRDPWYSIEPTHSKTTTARREPPLRVEHTPYRNIAPIQDAWSPRNLQSPGVATHARQYGSTRTILPTTERSVVDKDDGSNYRWSCGSSLRTAVVWLAIIGGLVYLGRRYKS